MNGPLPRSPNPRASLEGLLHPSQIPFLPETQSYLFRATVQGGVTNAAASSG